MSESTAFVCFAQLFLNFFFLISLEAKQLQAKVFSMSL